MTRQEQQDALANGPFADAIDLTANVLNAGQPALLAGNRCGLCGHHTTGGNAIPKIAQGSGMRYCMYDGSLYRDGIGSGFVWDGELHTYSELAQ
jgi:hypothetical protein